MKTYFKFTASFILAALFALHWSAVSTAAQVVDEPTQTDDVLRISTDLIQTSVTVLDKNNRFVENLKPEQFELRVDGKPVPIEFFEQIVSGKIIKNRKQTEETISTEANQQPAFLRGRRIIFFIDDLHLSLDSLGRTRSAIRHFIAKDMLPLDSVLITTASGQLGFLQQFTDNPAVLEAALNRLKQVPNTIRDTDVPPMPEYTAIRIYNGDRTAAEYYVEELYKSMKTKEVNVNIQALFETVKQRAGNIVSGSTAVTGNTLGSLGNLMAALGQTRERKLVYFISDGFYLESKSGNYIDNAHLQRVVNMATRSGSTFYTIDARGLFSISADATGDRPVDPKGRLDRARIGEETAAQEGLFELAEGTGGRFLKNTNYFDKWIDKTLEENTSYYILAWNPDKDEQTVKKFKKIEVAVIGRDDLTVRLQRGYLTIWEKPGNAGNKGVKETAGNIQSADAKEPKAKEVLPVLLSLSYLDVPNTGGVLTSSVQVATGGLKYGGDGKQSATIDVAGVIYNGEGKKIGDFKTGLSVAPNVQENASASGQSVIYNNPTPIAPGIYQVRVAARENQTGMTGTALAWIAIPDLNKKQLALGSLLLGVETIKKSEQTNEAQTQFSVDRRFSRSSNLDFMLFIYNAARNKDDVNLTSRIEILDMSGRAVIDTQTRPLNVRQTPDMARIPLSASIPPNKFVPGKYLLRVTVSDLINKSTAVQQTVFTIE